jgi:TIR domain
MLPAEKLELAIYRHVKALDPPVNVNVTQLSQITGEKDYGRIVERLIDLDGNIKLAKYSGGQIHPRSNFDDKTFFYNGSFFVEIAPAGRKYFEVLEQRATTESEMGPRKMSNGETPLMRPEKAIGILKSMVQNAALLSGEPFGSDKRKEWTDTARGVLARSFAQGDPILGSFSASRAIAFNMNSSNEELRRIANDNIASQTAVLRSAIEQLGWEIEEPTEPEKTMSSSPQTQPQLAIFISHSSKDRKLAEALTDLLKGALGLMSHDIRCSSVDGHRLPVGVDTQSKLRQEVTAARAVVGLVTPSSLSSSYVMFELGARWGAELFLAPLLAGVRARELTGPLGLLNALSASNEAELHQFLEDIATKLGLSVQPVAGYLRYVSRVREAVDLTTTVPSSVTAVKQKFRVEISVDGTPPEQRIKLTANHPIEVMKIEYMLSSEATIESENVSQHGDSVEIPVNDALLMKLWNTPRSDRNFHDNSGPAKIGIVISVEGDYQQYILPVQMSAPIVGNTTHLKLTGSKTFY